MRARPSGKASLRVRPLKPSGPVPVPQPGPLSLKPALRQVVPRSMFDCSNFQVWLIGTTSEFCAEARIAPPKRRSAMRSCANKTGL